MAKKPTKPMPEMEDGMEDAMEDESPEGGEVEIEISVGSEKGCGPKKMARGGVVKKACGGPVKKAKGGIVRGFSRIAKPQRFAGTF